MVAHGHDVHTVAQELVVQGLCQPGTGGGILDVGHDAADAAITHHGRHGLRHDMATRTTDHIADAEYLENQAAHSNQSTGISRRTMEGSTAIV